MHWQIVFTRKQPSKVKKFIKNDILEATPTSSSWLIQRMKVTVGTLRSPDDTDWSDDEGPQSKQEMFLSTKCVLTKTKKLVTNKRPFYI